jgi:serine/threonine-protein kinase
VAARTWDALARAHRQGVPVAPLRVEGLPREVERLCRRCLDPDPSTRPGSAEVARSLRDALPAGHADVLCTPIAAPEPARPRRSRPLYRPVLTAVVALAVAGTLLALATRDSRSGAPLGAPRVVPSTPVTASTAPAAAPPSPSPSPSRSSPVGQGSRIDVVQQLIDEVDAGRGTGAIRPDVALDLDNVLRDLRRRLATGAPVDMAGQVAAIRDKIAVRLSEGGLDYPTAGRLLSTLDSLTSP